ncbi:hypothetical protein CKO31_07850 [Thiohalocapsa halophila]|uniref:RepB-like DNA primase domain-containing protein n=1 Tax=Thiohalocapsa halophila TaxID=69359 RepID=A0ABS1CG03_9GAMM|nr:DNA-primase RepB domain-containing protein [Thiohalocapsa halophila]MBK1630658.1 hypothetical protein [Thiohalocapsa halophila]
MSAPQGTQLSTQNFDHNSLVASDFEPTAEELTPNREAIKDALSKIRPHGKQNLVAIIPDGSTSGRTFDLPGDLELAADWAARKNADGKNLHFTVNPVGTLVSKKPSKADIAGSEYVHVDIDPSMEDGYETGRKRLIDETLPTLRAFDLPPSLIIDSGNGLQALWRIEGADAVAAEDLNKRLIARFGGDTGTGNIDRLLRLPGTLNYPKQSKRDKGYPDRPGFAHLLDAHEGGIEAEALVRVLPQVQTEPAPRALGKPVLEQDFDEDTRALSEEEITAVNARLEELLERSPNLRRRWQGETEGLKDTSRSGLDFSLTSLLKANGLSYREAAHVVCHVFKHGKGMDNRERDLQRNWRRVGVFSSGEIVAACCDAIAQDDLWEPVLYSAHPNEQTIDAVLDRLSERDGFRGKRALKADYEAYVAQSRAVQRATDVAEAIGDRALVPWDPTQLNKMVRLTEDALMTYPGQWEVLLYSGVHTLIKATPPTCMHAWDGSTDDSVEVPVFESYTQASLRLRIEQSVAFCEETGKGQQLVPVPKDLPGLLLSNPESRLPVSTGLVTHPLISPGGEVLIEEGLQQTNGLYLAFGGTRFAGPADMKAEDGVAILAEEMLGEFPFASELDQAAALAFVLTAIQRKTLAMAPAFLINASTQGTGKTTLVRMVHLLLTGRDLSVTNLSDDGGEQEKALIAMLLQSVPMICFDNVPDAFTLKSPVLARALTSESYNGRILGMSKTVDLPTNTTFVVTGNNISTDADLATRMLEVRLQSEMERPDQRTFDNPDVGGYVLENRVRWMRAALAVLQCNERPIRSVVDSRYHAWDRAVRWPLLNAGVSDPIAKFDEVVEQSPDTAARNAWMLGLVYLFGIGQEFRSADLLKIDELCWTEKRRQEAYHNFFVAAPPVKGWGNVRSIGHQVIKLRDRSAMGYRLESKIRNGSTTFVIQKVSEEAVDPSTVVKSQFDEDANAPTRKPMQRWNTPQGTSPATAAPLQPFTQAANR